VQDTCLTSKLFSCSKLTSYEDLNWPADSASWSTIFLRPQWRLHAIKKFGGDLSQHSCVASSSTELCSMHAGRWICILTMLIFDGENGFERRIMKAHSMPILTQVHHFPRTWYHEYPGINLQALHYWGGSSEISDGFHQYQKAEMQTNVISELGHRN
jgi:hypothetical protein